MTFLIKMSSKVEKSLWAKLAEIGIVPFKHPAVNCDTSNTDGLATYPSPIATPRNRLLQSHFG